jgi:hypothetical protein
METMLAVVVGVYSALLSPVPQPLSAVAQPAPPAAAADPSACSTSAEIGHLGFWLGKWVVTAPGGTGHSTSTVSLSLGGCLVVEQWNDGKGHRGENVLGYSADDRTWRGFFADNHGRAHVFVEGTIVADTAEFQGPSGGPAGPPVLDRVRLIRTSPKTVEQRWEKSADHGATWTPGFRGEYTRTES